MYKNRVETKETREVLEVLSAVEKQAVLDAFLTTDNYVEIKRSVFRAFKGNVNFIPALKAEIAMLRRVEHTLVTAMDAAETIGTKEESVALLDMDAGLKGKDYTAAAEAVFNASGGWTTFKDTFDKTKKTKELN